MANEIRWDQRTWEGFIENHNQYILAKHIREKREKRWSRKPTIIKTILKGAMPSDQETFEGWIDMKMNPCKCDTLKGFHVHNYGSIKWLHRYGLRFGELNKTYLEVLKDREAKNHQLNK